MIKDKVVKIGEALSLYGTVVDVLYLYFVFRVVNYNFIQVHVEEGKYLPIHLPDECRQFQLFVDILVDEFAIS